MSLLPPPLDIVVQRFHTAPAGYSRTVATDADGTLWNADVGDALFCTVAARDDFRGEGLSRLRAHATKLLGGGYAAASGRIIADELFARYGRGEIDVRVMCDLEAETVADRPIEEFDALVAQVAESTAALVRADVRELIRALVAAGATVEVVTGSLGVLVEATLRRAEIPFQRVTGAVLRRTKDRVCAAIERTSPLFEGKVNALREHGAWPAAVGLGDGGWDHTFLRETWVPVLVHPKPALIEAMRGVDRVVLLWA